MVEKRTVVGIVPCFDDGQGPVYFPGPKTDRVYLRNEYMHVLASVGAVPLILSPEMPMSMITDLCDGVVISGGFDIATVCYDEEPLTNEPIEPIKRYMWEEILIEACDRESIPILGICYGMQRLNLFYGGTLLQDIELLVPENIGHIETKHAVTFQKNFLGLSAGKTYTIESRHHQAVDALADGWEVCASAPDGVIEAMHGRGHFAMQWHPESDETGMHIYRAFVEHCHDRSQGRAKRMNGTCYTPETT